jgi:hypothetical protein
MKRKKRKNNMKQRGRETSRKIGQTSSQVSGMQQAWGELHCNVMHYITITFTKPALYYNYVYFGK